MRGDSENTLMWFPWEFCNVCHLFIDSILLNTCRALICTAALTSATNYWGHRYLTAAGTSGPVLYTFQLRPLKVYGIIRLTGHHFGSLGAPGWPLWGCCSQSHDSNSDAPTGGWLSMIRADLTGRTDFERAPPVYVIACSIHQGFN